MTFFDDETGLDTSNPIELYRFSGSLATYTYTSSNREITYHAPTASVDEVYTTIALSRGDIILGDVTDRNELKIQLAINNQIIQDYAFNVAPTSDLTIEIYRQNGPTGAVNLIFAGVVSGIAVQGLKATITCPSVLTNYLDSEFPNIYYQSLCNHHLYDSGCTISQAAFTTETTVTSMIDSETMVVTAAAAFENGYFNAGEVFTATDRRLIVNHVGATLTLNWPFRVVNPGDPISISAGCLHDIITCDTKFDGNHLNFLGWPYIPYINPFVVGVG